MPRGDTLVALDTFVAPVTLDGGVPFHPRVLHHLWEGREGYQGRQWNHAPEPRATKKWAARGAQRALFPQCGSLLDVEFHLPDHPYAKQNRLETGSILRVLALTPAGRHLSSRSPAVPLSCRTCWRDLSSCRAPFWKAVWCRPNPQESPIFVHHSRVTFGQFLDLSESLPLLIRHQHEAPLGYTEQHIWKASMVHFSG